MTLVAVGLLVVSNPDVFVAALLPVGLAAPAFQVNVLPLAIVATNTSPKLLKDQSHGSRVTVDACTALPKPENNVAF